MADYLSPLVKHQKIFIVDAHGHENNPREREKMYDDKAYDLHLHKKTNPISVNGQKECVVDIRIPINNSDRDVDVEINGEDLGEIPGRIRREVARELNHRQTRERVVKELSDIMVKYPSSVKDDREKTEDALRRLTETFGITSFLVKDEWFTHINEDRKGLSMLSVVGENEERYNVLACDDFMLTEQAEPTKKYIIALSGAAQRGKTETIMMAFRMLMERYSKHAIIIEDGITSNDVKAILFINGAKVGIESEGDPGYRQPRSVDEFVRMGCDVILVASRTKGETVDSLMKHENEYTIDWFSAHKIEDEIDRQTINRATAILMADLVERRTIDAFQGL